MSASGNVQVLIAEDDYLVSKMVKGQLRELGYDVVGEAGNGVEAVDLTRSLEPDIVVMDIKMPDMDGIEATRRLNELKPTPVVVLTAYDTPALLDAANEAGVGAFLIKPPSARELQRAITISLSRFKDLRELRRLNEELREAYSRIKKLSGLLPICASCKRIRDDSGYWRQVEAFVRDHTEAQFSHSICPDCMMRLYPGYKES